ncbi:MAG TPA: C25 family cysteine peptidase [Mycobacterium sp.]|nr:C25 family cysteine peptidase [Mycobacterium sp.]
MSAPNCAGDDDLVVVNGINIDTGQYAFTPRTVEDLARHLVNRPRPRALDHTDELSPPMFGIRFGVDPLKLAESGWGVVFHTDTTDEVRSALQPLLARRRVDAADRFAELDYLQGEQMRDWYDRHGISAGNVDPEIVPYYLLLVGPPDLIPFEFQYLVGIEYAVGRLSFDTPEEYERYARSVVDYEQSHASPTSREIVYWGTRHPADPATQLSASMLITPLAEGIPNTAGALNRPVHTDVGYHSRLLLANDATRAALLDVMNSPKPPAMLFTASHGMAMDAGDPRQKCDQGALLCQDWSGFGDTRPDHFLTAADIGDDANVNGLIAFTFACFGAGTPDVDQFLQDLSDGNEAPPLAPEPFVAALPRRLLGHPNGGALAVIGHVDRAWGCSIKTPKIPQAQIGTFRNTIGNVLTGTPVGHAVSGAFGARFAVLSTALASATSPSSPAAGRLSDRELVLHWLERNDAQNYVVIGDPAARIRSTDC